MGRCRLPESWGCENGNKKNDCVFLIVWKIQVIQLELVDKATSSEEYDDLVNESDRLNEEKQKILVTLAEDKGRQEKKAELIDFLHEQTTEFEEFDDGLVRRLIEQITVHESGAFTVEFKSGTMVEV